MDAILLMVVPFVGFIAAYHLYGKFLARKIFKLDPNAVVPSEQFKDGKDFVPTPKGIIFGHHYTSIAGTGPIVGPAIAIIWGWIPAIIWIVLGSIFMGAVHDFGALVVSLRNQGKSISEVAGKYIGPRVRLIFFLIVFFELWIVIAIFALVIGLLFSPENPDMYPEAVFPVWMEIPIAIALGYILYKRGGNVKLFTLLAVVAMYVTVVIGHFLPIEMPELFGIPATGLWAIILLIYAYIASILPVTTLLQPRDYINAWQLFVAMALLILGTVFSAFSGELHIAAPAFQAAPSGAPPIWPFLFITIACGAISGFHCLVASGTSAKQLRKESDALFVGYGSMLLEGALAALVIVAVAAGIGMGLPVEQGETAQVLTGPAAWTHHYSSWGAAAGLPAKIGAFVRGSANMMASIGIPVGIGLVIMGVFVVSFAGTTLDTATRLQRYVISELATDFKLKPLANRWAATTIAVVTAGLLVFATGASGKGALKLWPMFGAVNQLLAALALLVVTMFLRPSGKRKYLITMIPCALMLVMTLYAVTVKEIDFIRGALDTTEKALATRNQNIMLACINAVIGALAVWMTVETIVVFFKPRQHGDAADATEPAQPGDVIE